MSDSLVIHLLNVAYRTTGSRRAAAKFLLRQLWSGVALAVEVERVVALAAEELGAEIAEAARDICRDAGLCD
jgi:hypothetical protein